jgi:hypothetical protein
MLFDLSGLSAVIIPSSVPNGSATLSFSNQRPNTAATNCSVQADLTSTDARFASWPSYRRAALLFTVDSDGGLHVPTLGGVSFQDARSDVAGPLGCLPAHFSSSSFLNSALFASTVADRRA